MKISAIKLYRIDLPIKGAGYQLSRNRLVKQTSNVVVEIVTDAGVTGWGESCPFGLNYLEGFGSGAFAALQELCPLLIGRNPLEIDAINWLMDTALTGHIYAKSAIDIACWDLFGKATGLPLYTLLGGMINEAPLVRTSVSAAEGDLVTGIEAKRRQGFQVLTLKVGDDPIADAELTLAIAAQAKPWDRISADANGGWLLHEAMTYVHSIQDAPGILIEQPCESLSDCVELGKRTNHPIVLDESIDDLNVLSGILRPKQVSAVNLKIERIGGITKTRQMRDLCLKAGCAMFVQEVGGAEITYAATTHLAHTIPEHFLLGATTIKVDRSLASGAPVLEKGRVRCNDGPGLGLEIDSEALGVPGATFQ